MFLEAGPCAPLFEPMEKILFDSHTHLNNDTLTEEARAVLAQEIGLCFPACLQTSNGATTENYEEEDIWNN